MASDISRSVVKKILQCCLFAILSYGYGAVLGLGVSMFMRNRVRDGTLGYRVTRVREEKLGIRSEWT